VAVVNSYKTQGIVLKRINFGEADRIITLYTKNFGKITAVAKGVRKMTSRKRGSLEIFNLVEFFAARGKTMDVITEVETLKTFESWRKDLHKVGIAYEMAEMVDRLTVEESEQEEIFDLLSSSLEKLEEVESRDLKVFLNNFGQALVKILGFWPRDKAFPQNLDTVSFVEQIAERELKSKDVFLTS
jgi:DNA repair protein RecO (recombination protein O)